MFNSTSLFAVSNRSFAYLLGCGVLLFAAGGAYSGYGLTEMQNWALEVFGLSFLVFLIVLVFTVIFAWVRQSDSKIRPQERLVWTEMGQHSASGITTLALTYTLLGISLGISSMAKQELNPETVQDIIQNLTRHFSMAFMTTVVGLPIAAAAQALVGITNRKMQMKVKIEGTEK